MNRYIFAVLMGLSFIGYTSAFKCYTCLSGDTSCLTPLSFPALLKDCVPAGAATGVCYKTYNKTGNTELVNRGCGRASTIPTGFTISDNECKETVIQGTKTMVCNCNNQEGCNSAFGLKTTLVPACVATLLLLIVTAALF